MVDLKDYRTRDSRVFSGRERGAAVRRSAELDRLDKEPKTLVEVRVPEDIFSVNSSFFLGMFGDSIRALGAEGFRAKYRFEGADISRLVDTCIVAALREETPI